MSEFTDKLETTIKNAREARAGLQAAIEKAEAGPGEPSAETKEIIRKAKCSLAPGSITSDEALARDEEFLRRAKQAEKIVGLGIVGFLN